MEAKKAAGRNGGTESGDPNTEWLLNNALNAKGAKPVMAKACHRPGLTPLVTPAIRYVSALLLPRRLRVFRPFLGGAFIDLHILLTHEFG